MNNVCLIGRLTKQVDLRYTSSGNAVATFTIAVNRTFKNQNGEREADFINCQVWKAQAENMANFTDKGSQVGITGRIQTRHYDGQDGKRVYVTEVVAESVQFLEPKRDGQQQNNQSHTNTSGTNQNRSQGGQTRVDADPFAGESFDDSDGLPF